jgi:predicted DNA-binding transcriptional regulator AlpA
MAQLTQIVGLGRSTIYRLINEGRFPKQLHPFGDDRVAAWRLSDIETWVNARCEGKPI